MQQLRLFSVFDQGVGSFMRPFWSDHSELAKRSFTQIVNDRSNPDNMIANYPDQFILFELAVFDSVSGVVTSHTNPISLGNGAYYVKSPSVPNLDVVNV